jgi:hypothetical protein
MLTQIPIDAMVIPLAAATAVFWILAAFFRQNGSCNNSAAALVRQDYAVVRSSTEMKTTSTLQFKCLRSYWEWDAMAVGPLPFSFGWLVLSTLYINITTNNGCR